MRIDYKILAGLKLLAIMLLGLSAPLASAETISTTTSDCLFNWAEKTYPQLFSPSGAKSTTYQQYYYRYYPGTGNYVAVSSSDNHIYVLGPSWNNKLTDVAPASSYLTTAGCSTSSTLMSAFFYQTVDPAKSIVRSGATSDGAAIGTYDVDLVYAKNGSTGAYGDPVFSRLKNGKWAMTTWGKDATTGLHYHEASCPAVTDAAVKSIPASSASGCQANVTTAISKTSQIFDVDGSNYLFTQSGGEVYLNRLTDSTRSATDLQSICVLKTPVTSLSKLNWGESTLVISKSLASGLLLSDVGIAKRKDGTWVLFIKGISSSSGCSQGSVCELCARSIYRTTSTDLITWSALEKVVTQASVPEAVTYPDGSVWLYYQNFSAVCTANNLKLAERAPITGRYEMSDYSLSSGTDVKFASESFETDTSLHYPTNGNPIALDADGKAALDSCMGKTLRQ